MSASFEKYKEAILQCLLNYQFIEESLRFCLIRCHATTKFRLSGFFEYEAPVQAITDAALGRLIDWYRPYTKNQELIVRLRKLKAVRDHVAHMSFILSAPEQNNDALMQAKSDELEKSREEARSCFLELVKEMGHAERAVNRAYEQLRAEYVGRGDKAPEEFKEPPA